MITYRTMYDCDELLEQIKKKKTMYDCDELLEQIKKKVDNIFSGL